MCVCSNLFNKADLALQLVGCPPQLNEAQLLLHLYAAKGLDMLGMLQGQYAFCLYDSKQVRQAGMMGSRLWHTLAHDGCSSWVA